MKNKALYIGLGVVAVGGLLYFMMRKKGADATASESAETKSAEVAPTEIATPSKGSALTTTQPAAATCGCGTGQIPCPNMRCGSKAVSSNKFSLKTEKPQPSTSVPKVDPETERFAFNLTF